MKESTQMIENKIDSAKSIEEIHEIVANLPKESFCVRVDQMREEHNIKNFSSLQTKVAMGRTQFFDVLNGKAKPQRQHVIKIGIAMGLSVLEINELLKLAHHKELYAKNPEDVIIRYGIENGMSIIDIEENLMKINATFSLLEN